MLVSLMTFFILYALASLNILVPDRPKNYKYNRRLFLLLHGLNMELDLQSLFGSCVQLYSLAADPATPRSPTPAIGLICEGAIGQPR
jgi:hypothetical protein